MNNKTLFSHFTRTKIPPNHLWPEFLGKQSQKIWEYHCFKVEQDISYVQTAQKRCKVIPVLSVILIGSIDFCPSLPKPNASNKESVSQQAWQQHLKTDINWLSLSNVGQALQNT